jgi:hypothetical protein
MDPRLQGGAKEICSLLDHDPLIMGKENNFVPTHRVVPLHRDLAVAAYNGNPRQLL